MGDYKRVIEVLNQRSCVCLFPKRSLQHLPVELIVNILDTLPVDELALWQTVSKQFRDIIANTIILQYRIECYIADAMEEAPHISRNKADQLKAIREWRTRWNAANWSSAIAKDSGTSLQPLPSITRGAMKIKYSLGDLVKGCIGHGCDTEHDVVVIARLEPGTRVVQLSAIRLTTQKPYPAPNDELWLVLPDGATDSEAASVTVEVDGSRVMVSGIYNRHHGGIGPIEEYWLFDWQSDCMLMNFWSDVASEPKMGTYSLFDEDFILLTVMDMTTPMLAVFDCYKKTEDDRPDGKSVERLLYDASLVFRLPVLREKNYSYHLAAHYQRPREGGVMDFSRAKFMPGNSSPVMHVIYGVMNDNTNPDHAYELLIPFGTLDKHIRRQLPMAEDPGLSGWLQEPMTIPWSEWGEDTRFFAGLERYHDDSPVSGSRFIAQEIDAVTKQKTAVIYDFCPPFKMLHDLAHEDEVEIVTEPTRVEDSEFFVDPVIETKAPYRRIKTGIVLEDGEVPNLTEDGVFLVDKKSTPPVRTRAFCI